MAGVRDEIIRCKGLKTAQNEFSLEDGAQRSLVNMLVIHENRSQSRRGIDRLATIGGFITKLIDYDSKVLVHHSNTGLRRIELDGTGGAAVGTINTPSAAPSGRIRTAQANENLYLTSNNDVQVLDGATSTPRKAGGMFAPGFDRHGPTTLLTGTGGFLADGFQCAYRYTLCRYDANNNLIEGVPSGRYIVANSSFVSGYAAGVAKNTVNRLLVPVDADTNYFFRVYRSGQVAVGTQPSDDLQLVFERYLTQGDITNTYVEITDIAPDTLRGGFLYTNPLQEGIAAANHRPPMCTELYAWKQRMWYGGGTCPSRFFFRILSVGGSAGIQNGDQLSIDGDLFTATTGAPGASNEYHLETGGTSSQNIEATAMNLVSAINKTTANTGVYAHYYSNPDQAPGLIMIESRYPSAGTFNVLAVNGSQRACFEPKLTPASATFDLVRAANVVTATKTSGNQSYEVGERVTISPGGGAGAFGVGPHTITGVTATTFTYAETGANSSLAGQTATIYGATNAASQVAGKQNRVYWSKLGMPEACPRDNFLDVGSENRRILAIRATDRALYVWKELEGIFRIFGDSDETFDVEPVDLKYQPIAAETVVVFDKRVWGLCDKGIVAVNEAGLEVMSNDVQEELQQAIQNGTIAAPGPADGVISTMAWALPYEKESFVTFFLPGDRDSQGVAGACIYGYTFQSRTRTWSKWLWLNNVSEGKTHGLVHPDNGKMYVADRYGGSAGDSYVYIERKDYSNNDYQDDDHTGAAFPIARTMAWCLQHGRAPTREKRWDEVSVLFLDQEPSSFTLSFKSNAYATIGTPQSIVMGNGNLIARAYTDIEAARRHRLYVELTNGVQQEPFSVAGLGIQYEVLDGKTTQ